MPGTNTVVAFPSEPEPVRAELDAARRRVAELEHELQRVRDESLRHAPLSDFSCMRLADVEGMLVKQAMDRFRGNVSRAARLLGLSRSALYRRLERHKL